MTQQRSSDDENGNSQVVQLPTAPSATQGSSATAGAKNAEYTDGRAPGEWESKYPPAARLCINQEACLLGVMLVVLSLVSAAFLGLSSQSIQIPISWFASQDNSPASASVPALNIDFRLLAIFFVGAVGGTTFSIKWLVHSTAKSKWHLDRRYWRLFVPLIGGVYACVVLTLIDGGFIGAQAADKPRSITTTAAFAFLVGYFSDGVSGLLSNIANAVFGTLEKK